MADPNILLNRAKSALLARDYQLAAKLYKTLINENPDVSDYKIQLGNLYVKSGKDDQALDVFKIVARKDFDNLQVLMAMAGIYRRQKKYDDSVAVLEQALMVCADSPEDKATINYNLGFTYRQMGNNKEAIHCFEEVIEEHPDDVLAYNHLGAIYAQQGDYAKATEAYQQGLKYDPNHPVLHFNIAKCFADSGELTKSISHYETALKAKPGWLDAIEEYANLLIKTDRVKEADEVVSNALKLNPDDVKMHTSMGNIYNRKSIYETAEEEFKKALSTDEEYKPALSGLARSQEKQGKVDEACETILKVHQLNPHDKEIMKQTAHVLLSANKVDEAYEKIQKLWEMNQKDLQTINLLGQYYIAKGDEGKIENCFDRIQSINPDYRDVYRDWGHRYLQKGDYKTAEQYLCTAIDQNKKDCESMVFLAKLYESQNNTEKALEMFKKASLTDQFNNFSKMEAARLAGGAVPSDLDLLDSTVNTFEQPFEDSQTPDSTAIEMSRDFDEAAGEEISMDDDAGQFVSEDEIMEESAEDGFDFDQFGMEKLTVESPEDAVSVDDIMKMDDDFKSDDNPDDFDGLIDDGIPVDEEDDHSKGFVPETFDLMENAEGNSRQPDIMLSEDEEEEDETVPQMMDDWNKEETKPQVDEDAIKRLEDQLREVAALAINASNKADEAIHGMEFQLPEKIVIEEPEEEIEEPVEDEPVEEEMIETEEASVEEEIPEEEALEEEISAEEEPLEEDALDEAPEEEPFAFDEINESEENEEVIEEEAEESVETEEPVESEAEEEILDEEDIDSAEVSNDELSPEELMLKRVVDMLPEIVNAIEDRQTFFRFKSSLELFKMLRSMLDYLPEDQKNEFLCSRNRMLLDYIISRLSGKPGLLATVKALISSGLIHDNPELKASEKEGIELTKEVIAILKDLNESLSDESLKEVLKKECESLNLDSDNL